MELYFLSVGYGEAMVLLDKNHCMVIDGGPPSEDPVYLQPETITLPDFLHEKHISHIDLMVCTHLHYDHVGGLADAAEQFPVKRFWINCLPTQCAQHAIAAADRKPDRNLSLTLFSGGLHHFERLKAALVRQNTAMEERTEGTADETLWEQCAVRLFGMDKARMAQRRKQFDAFCKQTDDAAQCEAMQEFDRAENTCSLALLLKLDGWNAMLTGDLCCGWEERSAALGTHAQVLKLTHHGQKDGMPDCLVQACAPDAFVMCADAQRTFDSACPAIYDRIDRYFSAQNKPNRTFTTGLLEQVFGTQDSTPPCAVCCSSGIYSPYYPRRQ